MTIQDTVLYEKLVMFVAFHRVQKNDKCMELDADCSPPFHSYCHASRDGQFSHIGRYWCNWLCVLQSL